MIAVILVLINLTTAILLGSVEDGLQTWRLSQHDLRLAQASRAADSARFYALSQFQSGLRIPTTIKVSSGFQARLQQTAIECPSSFEFTDEEEHGYQCWQLCISITQATHDVGLQQQLWLVEDEEGARTWYPE